MCDYSLEFVASRQAAVADRLVTTTFPNTITRGFAAADDVNTAVCLRPGTEIAFDHDVSYEHPVTYAVTCLPTKVARFRQIDVNVPHMHHDALEFATGEIVPLTKLRAGQFATVLQLPAEAKAEIAETKLLEVVR
jgi:imidazoleglycerol phosphate synthase glutamine amidotransferase subunit HisH